MDLIDVILAKESLCTISNLSIVEVRHNFFVIMVHLANEDAEVFDKLICSSFIKVKDGSLCIDTVVFAFSCHGEG